MNYYKVKTTSIDYCVEEEDVCWQFDNDPEIEEDSEEYYDAIAAEIRKIKASLPQTLELEIECEPEDLGDEVCEAISEETGWLVNDFSFEILKEKK